ncbi:MAG TPA: hypothetical protein VFQ44_06715 [Streptosporangiaceae bacterium]|nr:hypothetical protein [Streptosporangiaceae bacterium]
MAHDFPLEELGTRAFEQLAVALSMTVLGPGVEAFGSGPDGGREATYDGRVNWSATTGLGSGSWNGYVVIQAKQREHPADPGNNAVWLRKQINDEFDEWMSETSKRGRFPNYIIFVTNVRLSSSPGAGGVDTLNDLIRTRVHGDISVIHKPTLKSRGLRDWKIWHRDQLNGLLTVKDGIRRAFPAMLTTGDIVARLGELSGFLDPEELYPVLTAHARNTLRTERWVNFSEAGAGDRRSVEEMIIDLRADGPNGQEASAISYIVQCGDAVLRTSLTQLPMPRHIVLTGNPGNGKSTLSRFITQVYRTQFMANEVHSDSTRGIMNGTRAALSRLDLAPPKNLRWPIRVDLAELADDLGPSGDKSLLRWLCEKVTLRAEIDIKPVAMTRWLRWWPWILILDGLDEVTSPEVRRRILDEIESFIEEADRLDADLFVVLTTRPNGYTEAIAPGHFTQFDLRYLDRDSALAYGRMIVSQRLADDLDRRDLVLERFEKNGADPALVRLMKTPLQVLIITIILERFGTLPPDRFQLFWLYYDTVYNREAAKNTTLAPLLASHRTSITELHETVGLTLQIRSETSTDARALLPAAELGAMAEARLVELGHEPRAEVITLAGKLVEAATKRLVLLVPDEDNTVTFEVRSLQELMAARALSHGTDDEVRRRLNITAPSPHWRNTWVFAAGRLFFEGPDHRRDLIVEVVETTDKQAGWPGWLCPIGPELAADLLDDGLAVAAPKWHRRLLDVALRSLTEPVPRDLRGLARGLTAAATNNNLLLYIRAALKTALAGTPRSRATAALVATLGKFGSPIPGMNPYAARRSDRSSNSRTKPVAVASLLRASLAEIEETAEVMMYVENALAELEALVLQQAIDGAVRGVAPDVLSEWPCTLEALRDQNASLVLELLCGNLTAELWQVQDLLAQAVWPALSRIAVGPQLKSIGADNFPDGH